MLISLFSRSLCMICSYLYPAYASYKALSIRPESSAEASEQVERWLEYWAVVGSWTAIESILGFTFTWLPFYSLVKMLVFLYLSLPQTQGSTYIYRTHLAPLFQEHERDIDSFLYSLRSRAGTALAGGIGWLWEKVKAQLNISLPAGQSLRGHVDGHEGYNMQPAAGVHQPPTLQDPASGAAQQLYGLMTRYAGQYLPLAVSALSAAAASTSNRSNLNARAEQVPESINMPMPIPIPTPNQGQATDSSLRSRTYAYAQDPTSQTSAHRQSTLSQLPTRRVSRGRLSQHGSEESIHSNTSSGSGQGGGGGGWNGEMSYDSIGRDEANVPPHMLDGQGQAQGTRPGIEKRGSSWFAWGHAGEKPKTE